ncbi:MAG: sulfatase-like hydrolase/transferase [Candidatus Eisenbacteria bacterium]|uniref:Sulfatase-like hydrolase/transferase n=1 Tax=Eiseniibacteriota bacterium TaxID=2212470 RepID=A0A948W5Y3_UNCEI|nr:sulfatase-like hydrolase/transferase [Candidatus Eisenbacteria bacterium]MBU1947328.1 sulfatase-like hydrolase/transferase [Candidatus Eisenbacteria bacterium]MBU2690520.1 sulfatase-like hydrolase/transferase [Candidatus Eisenbacteria bacterium]
MSVRHPAIPCHLGFLSFAVSLSLIFAFGWWTGCGSRVESVPPVPDGIPWAWLDFEPEPHPQNILLVTLDTTRRDALGCYGNPRHTTPVLDSLARSGLRFDMAVAPAPITAPSHTTMLTALDPPEHGVRDNGRTSLPDTIETLAATFQKRGFETAAILAAFPLDRRFGLNQGFDHYDDHFQERILTTNEETSQRRADTVTDTALEWARHRSAKPFFLWVHYFDPHVPWDPPSPFSERFSDEPYLGEVAFMDQELGRLLNGLRDLDLLKATTILIVGDHGESLGEHGEESHSFFIYDATMKVPCLLIPSMAGRFGELRDRVYKTPIRLRDLAPTLANLSGGASTPWEGRGSFSLLPSLINGEPAPVEVSYLETLVPALDYGWSDLRGIRSRDWKYIRAPRPELYRLGPDPAETTNVIDEYPEIAARLGDWLDWYLVREGPGDPEVEPMDRETLERLRSLGYLQGGGGRAEYSGADPKDRVDTYIAISAAMTAISEYRPGDAIKILEPVVRQERRNVDLMLAYASAHAMAGDVEKAEELYNGLLEQRPADTSLLTKLIRLSIIRNDEPRAMELFDRLVNIAPKKPGVEILRGELQESAGRLTDAREAYEAEIESHPDSYEAYCRLALLYRKAHEESRAVDALRRALAIFPYHAPSLAQLADIAYSKGRMEEGDSLTAAAISADPNEPLANFRKGWRAKEEGDLAAARRFYQKAIKVQPEYAIAHVNLGNVYLESQDWLPALRHYDAALALDYESALLRNNQGVALAQSGRLPEAIEAWERALLLDPDEDLRSGIQRNLEMARSQLGL